MESTDVKIPIIKANESKKNQHAPDDIGDGWDSGASCKDVENQTSIGKLTKFIKPNLATSKMSDLKILDFTKANSSGTDFFTPETKRAFIQT